MIFGCRSMDIVRRPLCGCFVLSCMVGGIFRKPLGFRRCLPPARTEKALPFQAGRSPCTKNRQTVRLCLHEPKKVFEGSKGRFFKNAPWQGVGQRPTKGGQATIGVRLFRRDKVPARNTPRLSGFAFTPRKKVFEGSKGRFFKNAPWQGVGQRPTESEKACTTGHAFSGGTKSLHETPTDRPALPLRSEKSFWGAKGRFFKNAPLAGCGTASHKERASQPIGARLFRGETQEKADLTGMVKFAILYTRDEWITHNKKRMQFFLREGKKSEQAV